MGSIQTCLDKLNEQLNIDVDWMDPTFIQNLPITPHDMTSNQILTHARLCHPDNDKLLNQVAAESKDQGWLAIYTRMAVLMAKANINNIHGRVLLQTLPTNAYNTEETVSHARAYAREFENVGIPRDRFCIKVPATGAGMNACAILQKEGIQTLGTAVFSVHQAIAASQAGCLYISPYYNELRAHFDASVWPKSNDPALLHPMSSRLIQILETYKRLYRETSKEQPLLKNASFLSAQEAMATGELGCHSATLPHTVLTELSQLPYDAAKQPGQGVPKPAHPYRDAAPTPARLAKNARLDPLVPNWDGKLASSDIDYLGNGGKALDQANEADPETKKRLHEALEAFIAAEKASQAKIEGVMKGF
ncbi:hypothetical protein ASPWEDRAFT_34391 [Aspergillus wentii DTO 134E9]|uniref:Transaldolase n=1 Tax=Aspergillus wentii DTO 134E9 TaxID=1073089 RepID=A0A1L9S188_ASPWE|nr:uncharacterized protein ASPWEDRAFT_34391 [Aspergillus wentii DTO 134E9]KAI9931075.1 hypothetical protein MW887_010732 [Aspergillus wentii]OJJ40927.1 hypothetical protein ASPWEDRAFT_34391 [Aspergillus wentii DTO 134E9]